MQYNRIKFAVGLFVIIFFIVITTYIVDILYKKGLFDQRYNYSFNTQSAKDLSVGMPLKFSGFDVGIIENISLKNNGSVHIIFSVNEENKKWIRQNTTLKINKPLIGSAYIELQSNLNEPFLAEGAILKIIQSDDINEMISKLDPLIEKVIAIIDNIDKITNYVASSDSKLFQTLDNLNKFSKKLADDSLLSAVTGDKQTTKNFITSVNRLNATLHNVQNITKDVSVISSSLNKDIIKPSQDVIQELYHILKDISHKLQTLEGTVNAVGGYDKELLILKEQIAVTIEKSNNIMDRINSIMQDNKDKEVILP